MLLLTVNKRNLIFEKQGRIKAPWRLYMSDAYIRDHRVSYLGGPKNKLSLPATIRLGKLLNIPYKTICHYL